MFVADPNSQQCCAGQAEVFIVLVRVSLSSGRCICTALVGVKVRFQWSLFRTFWHTVATARIQEGKKRTSAGFANTSDDLVKRHTSSVFPFLQLQLQLSTLALAH